MKEKKSKKSVENQVNEQLPNFEETHKIEQVKLLIVIVSYGQAASITKIIHSLDIGICWTTLGRGTSDSAMAEVLGVGEHRKQIVFSLIPESKIGICFDKLTERFRISRASRGIAFTVKLTSVMGVSVYKFLTNSREYNTTGKTYLKITTKRRSTKK